MPEKKQMNKERIEYFMGRLKAMAILKREGKDVGALARGKTEEIIFQSVDDGIDAELAEKRRSANNEQGKA